MTPLAHLDTPAALIDLPRMQANIERMQARMNALGVSFRPHVKTSKCTPVARAQQAAGAQGITVSTLKEASAFFADGFTDILYAVGVGLPSLIPQANAELLGALQMFLAYIIQKRCFQTKLIQSCSILEERSVALN